MEEQNLSKVESESCQTAAKDPQPEGSKRDSRPGLFIKTFGCQMNEYDSEKVANLLSEQYRLVSSAEEAELAFVNTCSVREKGEHKLFSLLGQLRDIKLSKNPELLIGVGGCVAQQEGLAIHKREKAVNFVVGTHNISLIPSLIKQARESSEPQLAVDYREDWETLPEYVAPDSGNQSGSLVRGLVSIQRGCNKRCSFCVVPTTRGPEVSRAPEEILREVRLKTRAGAREILLLGQTVNSYGRDLSPRYPFSRLVREIADIEGVKRIRFTSPHPAEVKDDFIELYGAVPQLVPHIHLPLQSGSDRILKLMNRNYRSRRYLEIIDAIRAQAPEVAISTDLIVGFPTETEEDFQETLNMMETVRYGTSFSFLYSRRPNTTAKSDFSDSEEVPLQLKQERLNRLQELQDRHSLEINSSRLNTEVEVLIEQLATADGRSFGGRIEQNTWTDISGAQPKLGEIVKATVVKASPHGLKAEVRSGNPA